jgi:hypothetical protein
MDGRSCLQLLGNKKYGSKGPGSQPQSGLGYRLRWHSCVSRSLGAEHNHISNHPNNSDDEIQEGQDQGVVTR